MVSSKLARRPAARRLAMAASCRSYSAAMFMSVKIRSPWLACSTSIAAQSSQSRNRSRSSRRIKQDRRQEMASDIKRSALVHRCHHPDVVPEPALPQLPANPDRKLLKQVRTHLSIHRHERTSGRRRGRCASEIPRGQPGSEKPSRSGRARTSGFASPACRPRGGRAEIFSIVTTSSETPRSAVFFCRYRRHIAQSRPATTPRMKNAPVATTRRISTRNGEFQKPSSRNREPQKSATVVVLSSKRAYHPPDERLALHDPVRPESHRDPEPLVGLIEPHFVALALRNVPVGRAGVFVQAPAIFDRNQSNSPDLLFTCRPDVMLHWQSGRLGRSASLECTRCRCGRSRSKAARTASWLLDGHRRKS